MKRKVLGKILGVLMVVLAFAFTAFFYLHFDLEGIFMDGKEPVIITGKQIKKAKGKKDFTGKEAGDGVKELKKFKSWKKLKNKTEYATVRPLYILETDVYGLGRWSDYYTKTKEQKKKKKSKNEQAEEEEKKTEAIRPFADYSTLYSPFYIIALPDGMKILAQMDRGVAKAAMKKIEKGEEVWLPIGKKIAVSEDAKELLEERCKEEEISTKSVFYAVDDEWQGKNADAIFWGKIGITIFVFILATIILQLLKNAYVTEMFRQRTKERKIKKKIASANEKMKEEKEQEEKEFRGRTIQEMFPEEEKGNRVDEFE